MGKQIKVSYLIQAQYKVKQEGVMIVNDDNKKNPHIFFLNQYFFFVPGVKFKEVKDRILRTLGGRVALKHGKGCEIELLPRIKIEKKERKGNPRNIKGQLPLFS